MRINLAESHLFTGWLAIWLFVANVPTEASWPALSHFLRLFAWAMVWVPLVLVNRIRLHRQIAFVVFAISAYVIVLNLRPLKFDAVLMIANMTSALLVVSTYWGTRFTPQLLKALDVVLFAWAGMLVVQIVVFIAAGQVVDFHSLFFPYSEARYYQAAGGLYRFTGPHIEPGTYCAWTYGLALLRMLLGGRVLTPSTVFALVTLPLTLSAWGVVTGAVFVISAGLASVSQRQGLRSVVGLALLAGMMVYFFGDRLGEIQEYLLGRASLGDVSGRSKESAYKDFYANFSDYLLWGKNFTYDFCGGCLSPQDAGLGVNLTVYLGLLLTLLIATVVLKVSYRNGGWALVVFCFPLFFAKYFIWETVLWLVVLQAMLTTIRRDPNLHQPFSAEKGRRSLFKQSELI